MSGNLASVRTVRSIDYTIAAISGTGSLSARARRVLRVYVSLVRMGYDGVSAPMGAISDAVHRSSSGSGSSIRTVQRANSELETSGFIRRSEFRVGMDSKQTVIRFVAQAFAFWTRTKTKNVIPITTQSHNVVSRETNTYTDLRASNCRTSDRTTTNPCFNSQITPKEQTKQRAGARATNRRKKNALLYSLNCVLTAACSQLNRRDRKSARSRAHCELLARFSGVELSNPSGIDWDYWSKRWCQMTVPARESTMRREILPALLGNQRDPVLPDHIERNHGSDNLPVTRPTPEQVRELRRSLEARCSVPETDRPKPEYPEIDADDEEMRLLIAARDDCRRRKNAG